MGGSSNWWGAPMQHQVGFYEYGISPFHLRAFKGFFNPGAFNFAKRMGRNLMFIGPAGLFYYSLYTWATKKFEYYNRKEYLNSHKHHH
ncbi:hypothetical protein HK104_009483 [Borealophlyctis nickersoniae]|nr:hypothetical protein HK104_009483 [Borealophlyctis nickersoniae]